MPSEQSGARASAQLIMPHGSGAQGVASRTAHLKATATEDEPTDAHRRKSAKSCLPHVALAVLALCWAALQVGRVPQPLPASAPPSQFSAGRAFAHVERLARTPHSLATPANTEARDYIVGQLAALGLQPQVQEATARHATVWGWGSTDVTLGVVHNILVRKPGTARGHATRPALLLTAHYDSRRRSQGAAAAGASVAAMLETLRALQSGPQLDNDIICLIADGAEEGALGARAFAAEHPWAREVGLVLGFDNLGSSGPLVLTGVAGAAGGAVAAWASNAPHATGSSLMPEIYKMMDRPTNLGPLAGLGAPALLFANIQGGTGYTGAFDLAERLDRGMLQHEGDTMLQLARKFGMQPLGELASRGQVYFELPGYGMVHYSERLIWPATRFACLLFFGVACLAVKRSQIDPMDIVNGAIAFAGIGAILGFAAFVAWTFAPMLHPLRNPALGAAANDYWYLLAFAAFGSGVFVVMQRRLQAVMGVPAAALGALFCMLLMLLYASWKMPGATYLLTWPVMAALLAFGALYLRGAAPLPQPLRVLILLAGAAPGIVLGAPLLREVFTALSPDQQAIPMALLTLMLGFCTALLATVERRYLVRTLVLAGVACMAAGSYSTPYAAEPPQPNRLAYYKDAHTWKSYWILPGGQLDDWTRNFFPQGSAPLVMFELFDHGSPKVWAATAPRTGVEFPAIEVIRDDDSGPVRHVEFYIQSKNNAPEIHIRVQGGPQVLASRIDGRVLTSEKSHYWSLNLYGMGTKRMLVSLDLEDAKEYNLVKTAFRVFIQERIPGLPVPNLPARPDGMKPSLIPLTATTIAADTLLFR